MLQQQSTVGASQQEGSTEYDVVVLGAGVIGLSVALELHGRGLKVAVIGKDLPEDSDSVGFCSPWAGCNWYPFDTVSTTPASQREIITFEYLSKLAKSNPELCERIPFYSVWDEQKPDGEEEVWFRDLVGDYEHVTSSIPGGKKNGRKWSAFIMHAPNYLIHLSNRLMEAGVPMIRARVSSLDQAYSLPALSSTRNTSVKVVVNATGLGAQSLVGVEDPLVHPARGQTVLVKAPWCERTCIMHTEGFYPKPGRLKSAEKLPEPAYIIPRPNPTNSPDKAHFVCGGTYLPDNHSTLVDLSTAERILKEVHQLMPSLASSPQAKESGGGIDKSKSKEDGWKDVEVVSHNVGLRSARVGGARLELERRRIGDRPRSVPVGEANPDQAGSQGVEAVANGISNIKVDGSGHAALAPRVGRVGEEVAVVHAYGFGSAGYQQSWGAALQVADLVEQYFSSATSASS